MDSNFKIILCSSQQHQKADETNFPSWGAPKLTLDQYLGREQQLRQLSFHPNCWALVPTTSNETTLDLFVHCETFIHPCIIRHENGIIQKGQCIAIASVYTPEHRRRKGYCKLLMSKLLLKIKCWPNILASSLYSDIGSRFYDDLGWKCHTSLMATISVDHVKIEKISIGDSDLFIDNNLKDLILDDCIRIEQFMVSSKTSQAMFSILPSFESIEWQFRRGVIYANYLNLKIPNRCGIKKDESFLIWAHNFSENILYILRHELQDEILARNLISTAILEAHSFNLAKVCIWNPCDLLYSISDIPIEFKARESSLSSLACFDSQGSLNWVYNEKFAWV